MKGHTQRPEMWALAAEKGEFVFTVGGRDSGQTKAAASPSGAGKSGAVAHAEQELKKLEEQEQQISEQRLLSAIRKEIEGKRKRIEEARQEQERMARQQEEQERKNAEERARRFEEERLAREQERLSKERQQIEKERIPTQEARVQPYEVPLQRQSKGRSIYEGKGACINCHGVTGKGDGSVASQHVPRPSDFTNLRKLRFRTNAEWFRALKDGIPGTAMEPLIGIVITEDEAWSVIDYLRELQGR